MKVFLLLAVLKFKHTAKKKVGFRNIAIHDYRKLNLDILRSILDECPDDFRDCCRCLIHMDTSCA